MLNDFKEFALKGNVLDLAVGVIIAAAFGKVVTSVVEDVLMPFIGGVFAKVDFSNLYLNLSGQNYPSFKAAKDAGAAVIGYGAFLTNFINFLIVAAAVYFLVVKPANRFRRPEEVKEDLGEKNAQQNQRIIELLEQIAAKP